MFNKAEKLIFPTPFDYFTLCFLALFGLFFTVWFIYNFESFNLYLFIFCILTLGIFPLYASLIVLFAKKIYINFEQKYLRTGYRIIPFSDVLNFYYKHSFSSLKHPLAVMFVLNLKTGEQVKFYCYFRGSDIRICDILKKVDLPYIEKV